MKKCTRDHWLIYLKLNDYILQILQALDVFLEGMPLLSEHIVFVRRLAPVRGGRISRYSLHPLGAGANFYVGKTGAIWPVASGNRFALGT